MKNAVLKTIHQRKSVRAYQDKPIADDVRNTIIQAAMRAPTAGNMMLYSILEVSDQEAKDQLVETCDNQPFIAEAPLVLIFLADYQRWYDYFKVSGVEEFCQERGTSMLKPEEGDLFLASCDALIAAQTAVIAAESIGVGSCYIGDVLENYEIHREMFALPQYAVPICMLCFGYPTKAQKAREMTERFAERFIHHKDHYTRQGENEFDEMYAGMRAKLKTPKGEGSDQPDVGVQMYKRKFSADFSLEMRRSVRAMLDAWCA